MSDPTNLKYVASHEWIEAEGDVAAVGVSDHAQSELSDVVYVELPELGREVTAGEAVAVVESVKAASDIFAPVSGEIVEVNAALNDDPSKINNDPHGEGWLFKIRLTNPAQRDGLMTYDAYQNSIA